MLCNVTIPVQPSGPALVLGVGVGAVLALALQSSDPARFPLVDGSVGQWCLVGFYGSGGGCVSFWIGLQCMSDRCTAWGGSFPKK